MQSFLPFFPILHLRDILEVLEQLSSVREIGDAVNHDGKYETDEHGLHRCLEQQGGVERRERARRGENWREAEESGRRGAQLGLVRRDCWAVCGDRRWR